MFYEGTLQNGAGVGDRLLPGVDFPWPNPDKPMMFYCQLGAEEISASGGCKCVCVCMCVCDFSWLNPRCFCCQLGAEISASGGCQFYMCVYVREICAF